MDEISKEQHKKNVDLINKFKSVRPDEEDDFLMEYHEKIGKHMIEEIKPFHYK